MKLHSFTASTVCLTVASVMVGPPEGALALRPGFASLSGEDAVHQESPQELPSPTDPSFLQFPCFGCLKKKKKSGSLKGAKSKALGVLGVDEEGNDTSKPKSRARRLWRRLRGKDKKGQYDISGSGGTGAGVGGLDNPGFDGGASRPVPLPRSRPPSTLSGGGSGVVSVQVHHPQGDDGAGGASGGVLPETQMGPPKPPRSRSPSVASASSIGGPVMGGDDTGSLSSDGSSDASISTVSSSTSSPSTPSVSVPPSPYLSRPPTPTPEQEDDIQS
ncbi:hypothetical protein Emed_006987 [Eimeria media]